MLRGTQIRKPALTLEALECRLLLVSDWQNPVVAVDVDGSDGLGATPLDALLIVSELSNPTVSDHTTHRLPDLSASPPPFYDVNGDQTVSPLDALLVINALDGASPGEQLPLRAPDTFVVGTSSALATGVSRDTLVNTSTTANQFAPDIASFSDGSFVVAWTSARQDGSANGVFAQRYDASGLKQGSEFQVNTHTARSQQSPSIAVGVDDHFAIVWQSLAQDGSGWGVYGQRFDSNGLSSGSEFQVNVTTRGNQYAPDVAVLANGTTVATWEGRGVGDVRGIFARQFDASGAPLSGEVMVNESATGVQSDPSIAGISSTAYAVAWDGRGDGDSAGIFFRAFEGTTGQSEMRVGRSPQLRQENASIVASADGMIAVTWDERPEPGGGWGTRGQIYDQSLAPVGSEIVANQTTQGAQNSATAAFLADGSLVIGWAGRGPGDQAGIFSRMFATDGSALSDESLVNETTRARQSKPAIAAVGNGYVTAWEGFGDADSSGVFARFIDSSGANGGGSFGPFTISGTVFVDANGNSSTDASEMDSVGGDAFVQIRDQEGTIVRSNPPAADGTFEFSLPPGTYTVEVVALGIQTSDPDGVFDNQTNVNLTGDLPGLDFGYNRSPTALDGSCGVATVGVMYSCDLGALFNDPDGSELRFATSTLPAWLSIDQTGQLMGTPGSGNVGSFDFSITAIDPGGLSVSQSQGLTVQPAPVPTFVVSGTIFADADANGMRDGAEGGISDVTVYLRDMNNRIIDATKTEAGGAYSFSAVAGSYRVRVTAPGVRSADPDGVLDNEAQITVSGNRSGLDFGYNRRPVSTQIDNVDVNEGTALSYDVGPFFSDADGGTLTFETASLPAWLTFDPVTQTFSGTPGSSDAGSLEIAVSVRDAGGLIATSTFQLTVVAAPTEFTVSGLVYGDTDGDGTMDFGEPGIAGVGVSVVDSQGSTVFTSQTDDSGAWQFLLAVGDYTIVVVTDDIQTEDPDGELDSQTMVTVAADQTGLRFGYNRPPAVGPIADRFAAPDSPFTLDLNELASDPDGGDLTFVSENLPAWLTFNGVTGVYTGMPTSADLGRVTISVTATDPSGLSTVTSFDIVVDTGSPPVFPSISNQTTTVDCQLIVDASATNAVSYSASGALGMALPDWLMIDGSTGALSGTPSVGDIGSTDVTVQATNETGTASVSFTITVVQNRAPTIENILDMSFLEGAPVSIQVNAQDPDGACDSLSYSATANGAALPDWLTLDPLTGLFTGVAPNVIFPPEVLNIDVAVIDTEMNRETETFRLCIGAACPGAILGPSGPQSFGEGDQSNGLIFNAVLPADAAGVSEFSPFADPDDVERRESLVDLALQGDAWS